MADTNPRPEEQTSENSQTPERDFEQDFPKLHTWEHAPEAFKKFQGGIPITELCKEYEVSRAFLTRQLKLFAGPDKFKAVVLANRVRRARQNLQKGKKAEEVLPAKNEIPTETEQKKEPSKPEETDTHKKPTVLAALKGHWWLWAAGIGILVFALLLRRRKSAQEEKPEMPVDRLARLKQLEEEYKWRR